jgi:hypothetical protein
MSRETPTYVNVDWRKKQLVAEGIARQKFQWYFDVYVQFFAVSQNCDFSQIL